MVRTRHRAAVTVRLPLRAWRLRPTGLGRCAPEPPHVMSRLRLWAPRLLLTWQLLWLPVQASHPPEWALDPIQLTSEPPGLTEPWSSHSSNLPPESPRALTPPAEPGGLNYLGASSPAQMLALPQELTETLVPFPDTDSAGELPPGPDQFAVPHRDLNDKLTQRQRLPEVIPMLGWDQNQALGLPPRLKNQKQTVGLGQAGDHQSFEILFPPLDGQSSKPARFIVSPSNLKKELAQHRRLAKIVVGTPHQFAKQTQHLEQQLQDDYLDSSMESFYREENQPMDFLGAPDQSAELSEEAEVSPSLQEAQTHHPETPETSSQHPEPAEEIEPLPLGQPLEPPKEAENSANPQGALSTPPESPEESKLSSVQQEAPAEPSNTLEEVEPAELQQSDFHNVTDRPVDVALTVTPEVTKEVETPPTQQEAPAQPPELLEETELAPSQQEAPAQPTQTPEEVQPPPGQQEAPAEAPEFPTIAASGEAAVQPAGEEEAYHSSFPNITLKPVDVAITITPEPIKDVESSTAQQEAPAQPSEPPEEIEPSPFPQEALTLPAQPPEVDKPFPAHQEAPTEAAEFPAILASDEVLSRPAGVEEVHHSDLSTGPLEPVDVAITITPEPVKNVESSTAQQEAPPQPLERPEEAETSPTQKEAPGQSPGEVEPSATLQEQPAQPPEHHEVSVSPPGHHDAQPLKLPNVTVKPADVQLTLTAEPTTEVRPSPVQHEAPTLHHEKPPTQQEAPTQHPEPTEGLRPPVQHEYPSQPPESFMNVAQPSVSPEVTFSPLGLGEAQHPLLPNTTSKPLDLEVVVTPEPTKEVGHSPVYQEAPPQSPVPPEQVELSPAYVKPILQSPESPEKAESSLGQQEAVAQTPDPLKEIVKQEAPAQPPEPPKEIVAQSAVHNEMTAPPQEQDQAHNSSLPSVPVTPVDVGVAISSEPTTVVEQSTALQQTTAPPDHSEVTLAHPEQAQDQHPNLTGVTVPPLDTGPTVTPEPTTEFDQSTALQQTTAPPGDHDMTLPHPEQAQDQHPNLTGVTVPPLDTGPTVTPEPTTEVDQSTALQQTTAPPGDHDVTLPHPEQAQDQHPNLTGVTVPPVDGEVNITQQPGSPEIAPLPPTIPPSVIHPPQYAMQQASGTEQPEQNPTTHIKICVLCSCKDETLSCIGLSPKQKLRTVPVLEPHAYNGTLTILNFQGNYISYIDENIWNTYRWAEKLILSENFLSELHKDSFEGLLSLQYLILSRNPLTTVEDSYLFKLPALKYLDMGTTQVSLATIESILMMTLELEKLVLPSRMACCLCQFKNNIEVVCKTVKLHCDSECLTNTTRCDEEASIGNAEGSFMKVLQARKKNTSTELTIVPEKASSDKNGVSLSAFMNEQLDFNDESDVISALNYILPYFSEGNLEDVESTLLPFIKLLFSSVQDGAEKEMGHLKNNTKNPSLIRKSSNSTYKNKLKRLYFLENLLDAEIQEKIDEVKKKEKIAMLIHSNLLGPKFKRQIFQKKLETAQPQENSPAMIQSRGKRLLRVNRVLKGPKGIQKRHFKEVGDQRIKRKQNAQPFVENVAKERRLRPSSGELEPLHMAWRPRKLVGNSFNTEPSSLKEDKTAVSSFLKQYSMGSPSDATALNSLSEVKNKSKDLSYTIFVLEDANARVRNMKASKPISHSRKKSLFHKTRPRVVHRTPKVKMSQKFREEGSLNRLMLAKRPPFSAVRSLINSPSREAFSSSELTSQENPFLEFSPSEPSAEKTTVENTTAQNGFDENIPTENTAEPEDTVSQITASKNVSTADAAVTADSIMPTVKQTNETQWEYQKVGTGLPSKPTHFPFPLFSSPGDQFETQLNQQLRSLIPNNDVRRLISHVIRTLKMDCSETHVQLACAKLISRTGLLMKLLSEQQDVKVSQADWDTDQWKTENYINESTEAQSEQKQQESSELTKEVPGYGYNNKVILTISVTVVVMILIIIFCLTEIYSHRTAPEEGTERSSRSFFRFLRKKRSTDSESKGGFFWRRRPLWLRDMYRPLNATRKKNMAQKLHDKDSSDEEEIFNKDTGELAESLAEKIPTTESVAEEGGEESEMAPEDE
ncbi:leucine-rich repeat-containing protein 37A3-like isoform X3 [Equus asinus]|uniref:leucine-rich repeat-containing protein 37A3-like isoform X3 n=1 Tax=Equus asinus TaxID=9793 RepID=UPI0038F69B86